jgi:endonuclease/exonuclease/phosphatase family metal-dependent hydrolase
LAGSIKMVAFNAQGCGNPDAVAERLGRPPLQGADVILLSEADWRLTRTHKRRTAADLAELLGMSFAYSPEFAFRREEPDFTAFFGNALLAATPLENVRVIPLPMLFDWTKRKLWGTAPGTVRNGQRGAVAADIVLDGRIVTVALAHLENRVGPEGRAHQMQHLVSALPAEGPAIVGGDLNTATINLHNRLEGLAALVGLAADPRRLRRPQPYEPLFAIMERAGFTYREANAPLQPTFTPSGLIPPLLRPKLDWIAARGLKPVPDSARVVRARRGLRRISDHDFVVCDFEF